MENEENKTENGTAGNKTANSAGEQAGQQEALAQLWKFINNPIIANAGLGVALYWVFDPKGMKATLSEIKDQMRDMAKVIDDQHETLLSLKKQVVRMRRQLPAAEDQDNGEGKTLNGYRKAKQTRTIFLD